MQLSNYLLLSIIFFESLNNTLSADLNNLNLDENHFRTEQSQMAAMHNVSNDDLQQIKENLSKFVTELKQELSGKPLLPKFEIIGKLCSKLEVLAKEVDTYVTTSKQDNINCTTSKSGNKTIILRTQWLQRNASEAYKSGECKYFCEILEEAVINLSHHLNEELELLIRAQTTPIFSDLHIPVSANAGHNVCSHLIE